MILRGSSASGYLMRHSSQSGSPHLKTCRPGARGSSSMLLYMAGHGLGFLWGWWSHKSCPLNNVLAPGTPSLSPLKLRDLIRNWSIHLQINRLIETGSCLPSVSSPQEQQVGLVVCLKQQNTCLASQRPRVQIQALPVPQKW
jgi:hypothetical protein